LPKVDLVEVGSAAISSVGKVPEGRKIRRLGQRTASLSPALSGVGLWVSPGEQIAPKE